MVDAETPQAGVAFRGHVGGRRGARGSVAVDAEAELREDQRPLRCRQLLDGASHDLFREPGTVDRSGVDPVDAMVDGGMNGLGTLCLLLPAPHVAADCPGTQTNRRDVVSALAECPSLHARSWSELYVSVSTRARRWPALSRRDYNVPCSWRQESVAARGCAIVLSMVLAMGGGCMPRSSLPASLADRDFWSLIETLSEPAGTFTLSDNVVSNEPHYADTVHWLRPGGGAYVGVGPEQNFSYIVGLRPAMAFVIDIRRENLDLHLHVQGALRACDRSRRLRVAPLFPSAAQGSAGWRRASTRCSPGTTPSQHQQSSTRKRLRSFARA